MMRHCRLPLVVSFECRLAAHLHLPMVRVRRAPLALVLLWLNYAAQADGMETWWLDEVPGRHTRWGLYTGEGVRYSGGHELQTMRAQRGAAAGDFTGAVAQFRRGR